MACKDVCDAGDVNDSARFGAAKIVIEKRGKEVSAKVVDLETLIILVDGELVFRYVIFTIDASVVHQNVHRRSLRLHLSHPHSHLRIDIYTYA